MAINYHHDGMNLLEEVDNAGNVLPDIPRVVCWTSRCPNSVALRSAIIKPMASTRSRH